MHASKIKHQKLEMERVRLQAEVYRMHRYREVAEKYSAPYYEVCTRLCALELDKSPSCQYIMDYFKTLCENG